MPAGGGKIDKPILLNKFCDPIERSVDVDGVRRGCRKEGSTVSEGPSFSCCWEISLSPGVIGCAKSKCIVVRWWDNLLWMWWSPSVLTMGDTVGMVLNFIFTVFYRIRATCCEDEQWLDDRQPQLMEHKLVFALAFGNGHCRLAGYSSKACGQSEKLLT